MDFDKWRNVVKSYQEKSPKEPSKITEAEQKFQHYKELFEESNSSLTQEIGDLYENRFIDFEEAYSLVNKEKIQFIYN